MPWKVERKGKKQRKKLAEQTVEMHRGNNYILYQEGRGHINEQPVLIQDVDEGQIVPLSNLIIVMVMGWGDFDST